MYKTINVSLDDITIPVTVNTEGFSIGATHESGFPPNTRYVSPICIVDQGYNVHGSLREDFYLLPNEEVEFNRIVLWSGDTGSQSDDGIARLCPMAWANTEDLIGSEGNDLEKPLVAAIIFYAWLVFVFRAEWGYDDPEVEFIGGELLEENVIEIIVNAAKNEKGLITSEIFPEIIRRIEDSCRKADEEERRRRRRRPSNKKILCKIDIWDDFTPTTYEYHIQFLKRPSPRYRLWERNPNYWTPTDCFTPAEDDLKIVGKKLLKQYFGRWPSDAAGHSAGEILTDFDINALMQEMHARNVPTTHL